MSKDEKRALPRFIVAACIALVVVGIIAFWIFWKREQFAPVTTVTEQTPAAKDKPKRPISGSISSVHPVVAPVTQSGPASVKGKVFTLDATPAADAGIEIKLLEEFDGPPVPSNRESKQTVCDSEGAFAVQELRHGYYAVLARRGDATAVERVQLRPHADIADLLMILRPSLPASGHVEDESGMPIPTALLEPVLHDGGMVDRRIVEALAVSTDDRGEFNFIGLEPTTWEICVTADGFGPLRAPLQMNSAENRFVLRKGQGITGKVIDANDASEIPGAVVTARERDIEMTPIRVRSGPDGTFSFPPVQPGRYLLDMEFNPFVLAGGPLEVEVKERPSKPVILKAISGGNVSGHALDAVTREGIAGVYLRAWPKQKWVPRKNAPPTGADGAFQFTGLSEGEYEINIADAHGYNRTSRLNKRPIVRVAPGEEITDVEVLLFRGGTISGFVVDPEGHAVAGAKVRGRCRGQWDDQCDSAADGSFTLTGLDAEINVTLSASSPKWASEVINDLHVPKEGIQDVKITMTLDRSASVAGVVVNSAGQPMRVKLMAESRTRPLEVTPTLTDSAADGRFVLANLFEDEFDVSGMVTNGKKNHLAVVRVRTGETLRGQRWVMPTGNTSINGKVVDNAGKPVAARIEYRQFSGNNLLPPGNVSTGIDGAFTIGDVEEGDFLLSIAAKGYASQQMVPAHSGDSGIVITLESFQAVTGRVFDAKTGQAIEEFEIASAYPNSSAGSQIPGNAAFRTVRDPGGAFSLELEQGNYLIAVRARGYSLARANAETGPGLQPEPIEFGLQPGGAIVEGQVVDASGTGVQGALIFAGALPRNAEFQVALSNARTDEAGTFSIEGLPPGPIDLSAAHSEKGIGFVSGELTLEKPTQLTIVLNSTGGIEGTILRDGNPVSGATISVEMDSGGYSKAQTDESGYYVIKGLLQGTGTMVVTPAVTPEDTSEPQTVSREVSVSSGQTITVDAELTAVAP